jgi:hypothetical protein
MCGSMIASSISGSKSSDSDVDSDSGSSSGSSSSSNDSSNNDRPISISGGGVSEMEEYDAELEFWAAVVHSPRSCRFVFFGTVAAASRIIHHTHAPLSLPSALYIIHRTNTWHQLSLQCITSHPTCKMQDKATGGGGGQGRTCAIHTAG